MIGGEQVCECGHREHFHGVAVCYATLCDCRGFVAHMARPDPSAEVPGLARHDGLDTMHIAALRAAPAAATQRGRLLIFMHDAGPRGLTALEAEQLMLREFPRMRNVRARITELRDQRWLLPYDDRTRMTDSGSPAHINVFDSDAEDEYESWLMRERQREILKARA